MLQLRYGFAFPIRANACIFKASRRVRDSNPRKYQSSGQISNFCYIYVTANSFKILATLDFSSLAESEGFEPPKLLSMHYKFQTLVFDLLIIHFVCLAEKS